MSYDEKLVARLGRALRRQKKVTSKKMFGGVTFMLGDKMFCGVVKDELMVRVGPDQFERALSRPGVRPMDFTGRPMKGFVYVAPVGLRTGAALKGWTKLGLDFVSSLEPTSRAKTSAHRTFTAAGEAARRTAKKPRR